MPQTEVIKQEVERVPVPVEDTAYVTIPALDIFEQDYPTIRINRHAFEPGKTYLCSRILAEEVERRKALFDRSQRRLFQNRPDRKAIDTVNQGSNWVRGSAGVGASGGVYSGEVEATGLVGPNDKVVVVKE